MSWAMSRIIFSRRAAAKVAVARLRAAHEFAFGQKQIAIYKATPRVQHGIRSFAPAYSRLGVGKQSLCVAEFARGSEPDGPHTAIDHHLKLTGAAVGEHHRPLRRRARGSDLAKHQFCLADVGR